MKMKNKITYATAYRDWLAALGRMWATQRHYPKSDDYGHAPDPCHGCRWPNLSLRGKTIIPNPVQTMDDFKKKYNNYGP